MKRTSRFCVLVCILGLAPAAHAEDATPAQPPTGAAPQSATERLLEMQRAAPRRAGSATNLSGREASVISHGYFARLGERSKPDSASAGAGATHDQGP